ncbi:MAG: hypothetical protein H8E34_04190 [Bacteroidetes bacterium]|nr:hypothetical protein [Bacteroidota bacterium]MBL6943235.1 hypothetical protein [Bacteroidales bacterium]
MAEYIIKVFFCQVILFLFYHFSLAREKMHQFNRYYLIFSLLFSVIIPMIKIPVYFPTAVNFLSIIFPGNSVELYNIEPSIIAEDKASFPFSAWLTGFYILALLIFTIRMIRNLFLINLVAMVYERIEFNGYEIILAESNILPYSFLKRIFVNRSDYESGKISDELLMHELYHIQQRHSIDVILAEIIQTLFWFNPILILHNRAIRLNHEYLADNAVVNNQVKLCDYQKVLIDAVSKNNLLPITSGFSATWTKKRLMMMSKNRSVFSSSFRISLAIPIIFLIAVSFMCSSASDLAKSKRELIAIFNNYPNFYGSWEGTGRFNNISLNDEVGKFPVKITVKDDKTIEATVGDAFLYDINILKVRYGIEIQAMLSQPVRENEKINKDRIILLWVLPEIDTNKVDVDIHLKNNFFFDAFMNVGGVILTKSEHHSDE